MVKGVTSFSAMDKVYRCSVVAKPRETLFRHILRGVLFYLQGVDAVACCFFGHHDAPESIKGRLAEEIESVIKSGETEFFVGTHGHFDYMVIDTLRSMKEKYPQILYSVVLAYMPDTSPDEYSYIKPEETLFPDGLESVPRKFAILWRNDWMLKQSDTVICYAKHSFGGAGKFTEKAVKQKKRVINLAQ